MSNELQDQELLQRYVRDGSESAFRQLVERHVDLVYGAAYRRLNDQGAAEEAAQNAFIALARRAPFLVRHPSLAGWLYHTAANLARQQSRTESRRRVREATAVQLGSTMPSDPSSPPLTSALDETLLELRADEREALVLRYFEDKSLREVGAALGVHEDAAQKRVARALESLSEKLRRRGCALPVVAAPAALRGLSHIAPAGLGSAAAKAALATGGAASLSGFTLLLAKVMTASQTQTVVACALIAATPVALEWNAAAGTRAHERELRRELAEAQGNIAARQSELDQSTRRLATAESTLAEMRATAAQHRTAADAARSGAATNYYRWSDSSEYVRIPKALVQDLTLVTEQKRLPLDLSGTEPLRDALGMTPGETMSAMGAFGKLEQNYREALQTHAYFTNQPPANFRVDGAESQTLVTTPFGDVSARLKDDLRTSLDSILGRERADVVWNQAGPLFRDQFNDFGTRQRFETVTVNANGMIMYWKQSSIPGVDFSSEYLNMGLGKNVTDAPEQFRPFLAAQFEKLKSKTENQ